MTMSQHHSNAESSVALRAESTTTNARFRESSVVSGSEVASIFLITALLLVSFSALAFYAKRNGWLLRIFGKSEMLSSKSEQLKISDTMRISKHTTLHKISNCGCEFILIESTVNTSVHSTIMPNIDGAN